MNAETTIEPTSGTDLIVHEAQKNAVALFTNDQQYDEFFERVKASVSGFVPDLTTDRGRKAIAKEAFKVTKAKTTLDKAGLKLTEEARQLVASVNASRKKMTTQLDELAAEVRRPLTEWEAKEQERQAKVDAEIARFRGAGVLVDGETADEVEKRGRELHAEQLDPELYQERLDEAAEAKAAAVRVLAQAMHRLRQEEADRAELEQLRREREEREAKDRAEQEQREAAERERQAAEARERAAREAEERRLCEIEEAKELARLEAEQRAEAERRREAQARDRQYQEQLAAERRERERVEAEAAEARRKEQERLAWEAKEQREKEAREADERHRRAVIEEIEADIARLTAGANPAAAIANAIAAGVIRHVSVRF